MSRRPTAGGLWAVVPVKPFALAKQRLAPALAPEARARLAEAMLRDVLAALGAADGLAGTLIVSAEPQAEAIARAHGAELLHEARADGLNAALGRAAAHLAARGANGLLAIPGDVPGVTAAELERLIGGHGDGAGEPGTGGGGRALSLVAAHDGQGTNGLLATPPGLIGFAYGPGSLDAHRAAAAARGVTARVHQADALPGLAFDVDTPGDLARLGALPAQSHARRALAAEGISPISV